MGRRQAQTWSMDLIVAVIVFIAVVAAFYAFLSNANEEDEALVLQDAAKAAGRQLNCDVSSGNAPCVIEKGILNESQLQVLLGLDYETLRSELGIKDEFCIYIKDIDGNLIPISGQSGIGSSTLILSDGVRCNQALS